MQIRDFLTTGVVRQYCNGTCTSPTCPTEAVMLATPTSPSQRLLNPTAAADATTAATATPAMVQSPVRSTTFGVSNLAQWLRQWQR